MITALVFLAAIAIIWTLAYRGSSLPVQSLGWIAVPCLFYGCKLIGIWGLIPWLLLLTPILVVLNVKSLRAKLITSKIFGPFRKALPEMSPTEREALEAGDVWWEAQMFRGRPEWKHLQEFEITELTAEEQAFLDNETETLCRMIDDWEVIFEKKDLPEPVWQYIRDNGFFSMLISKEHGGLGFSANAQSLIVSKIATRSITAAVTVMVPNSLGPGELIMHYGTEEQKTEWLPKLVSGEEIPCFGLTGPEVGSDASTIPDLGVVCKKTIDGEEVLGLNLTFSKRYITLAPVATVVGLAVRCVDPDGLIGEAGKDHGITCVLLPADTEGVDIGRRHYPGAAFMNGPIRGKDIFVPLTSIIGGLEKAGKGWRMLVECLSAGRGISLPALAAAAGRGAYATTGSYSRIRRQFNMPIGKFEGVQEASGRIAGMTYRLEACRRLTASAVDNCAPSVVTAMMKYHMTEMMRSVITDSMDVHSGRTIMMGPRNFLAGAYQAAPVAITVEGANIMTRSLIIFGQGAIRCHPFVFPEMEAARIDDEAKALKEFDQLFWGHIGYSINRATRAFTLGLLGTWIAKKPAQHELAHYYQELERRSAALAFTADVAMGVLGGALKRKERMSARLGDVLSHLYMGSAVLKYYEDAGLRACDKPHAEWALQESLAEIDNAFHQFIRNFPMRPVAKLLKLVVFPRGGRAEQPNDELVTEISELMMEETDFARDMIDMSYIDENNPQDVAGRLAVAFRKLQEVEPFYEPFLKHASKGRIDGETLEEKLADAIAKDLLSEEQAQQIREYDALRFEAILTDDFSKEYIATSGAQGSEDNLAAAALKSAI